MRRTPLHRPLLLALAVALVACQAGAPPAPTGPHPPARE
jgi:hypothetical protein